MNRVSLEDDHIQIIFEGDQTYESVQKAVEESLKYNNQLELQNKPIHTIVDLTKIGKISAGARTAATKAAKSIFYEKAAVFGVNGIKKKLIQLVIDASGKGRVTKMFDSKEEAVNWLKEHD